MGILDEAIKEHLELKRQHGAGESELKQLEDEAFGDAERPGDGEAPQDPFAEAPTEFMSAPEAGEPPVLAEPTPEKGEESPRRTSPDIAGLQEAPEPPSVPDEPAEEEQPAMEHEIVADPPEPAAEAAEEPSPGHSTEERHAIAEQPTEMYDVEGEIAASESAAPSEEELVEEEMAEPRLAPVDPLAGLNEVEEDEGEIEVSAEEPAEEEEEDDFFDEKRLYEELDQALEAPVEADEEPEEPESLVEVEEVEVEQTDEHELPDEEESEEHEDLLEDTPDFLEDAPEDDQLWFEQKPPKDFDFDD
jgi:hypothetical protein